MIDAYIVLSYTIRVSRVVRGCIMYVFRVHLTLKPMQKVKQSTCTHTYSQVDHALKSPRKSIQQRALAEVIYNVTFTVQTLKKRRRDS